MNTTRRSSVRLASAASQRRQKPEPEPAIKTFFKIILLSTLKNKTLKIPARFVRLGPKLSNIVTLETPSGLKRLIRIKRVGKEVWFENGWSEFAEAHCLSEGHLLVFHYTGKSSFRVVIFDNSASEIEYPLEKVHVIESDDDDEDLSVEVIDLEELRKKKSRIDMKCEKVTTFDDVEEIESMDVVEEGKRIFKG